MSRSWIIFFLSSLAIYRETTGNEEVNQLNNLVKFPKWNTWISQLKRDFTNPYFIDFDIFDRPFTISMNTFFPEGETEFVTEENFKDKVKQYHLLLSFVYAGKLMGYLHYSIKLWDLCLEEELGICKVNFKQIISRTNAIMIIIKSSLCLFSKWLSSNINSETKLRNLVHKVIDNLVILTSTINNQIAECTTNQLKFAYYDLQKFYKIHFKPEYDDKRMFTYKRVQGIQSRNISNPEKISELINGFKKYINNLYDGLSSYGFIVDFNNPEVILTSDYLAPLTD